MMNSKYTILGLIILVGILGGVYYYLNIYGKTSVSANNVTTTTQKKTGVEVKPGVYVRYSQCYPNGPDTDKLINQPISFSNPNPSEVDIEFYGRLYSKITNLTATVNKTTLQFQGPVYLIVIKEYTDESNDANRYAKCVRKVTIQLVGYPLDEVEGIRLEWYKVWKGQEMLATTFYHRI